MKIVVLERNSVGLDIPVDCFEKLGDVIYYPNTVTAQAGKGCRCHCGKQSAF